VGKSFPSSSTFVEIFFRVRGKDTFSSSWDSFCFQGLEAKTQAGGVGMVLAALKTAGLRSRLRGAREVYKLLGGDDDA
jgi:hypothetical protein